MIPALKIVNDAYQNKQSDGCHQYFILYLLCLFKSFLFDFLVLYSCLYDSEGYYENYAK